MFSASSRAGVSSALAASKNLRLKVHFSAQDVNFDLIADIILHSRILEFIQGSIDKLCCIFGNPTSMQVGHDLDLTRLKDSYLNIFTKESRSTDPSKEDRMAAFLIFRTLRDCSLLINIVRSTNFPTHSLNVWKYFEKDDVYYSIQLIDLDEKFYTNLSSYLLQYQSFEKLDPNFKHNCFYSTGGRGNH